MIAKITTGASFKGAELYDEGKMKEGHKIIRTLACKGIDMDYTETGEFAPNPDKISRSFRVQSNLNPKVEKPVKHIVLSWSPEDADKLTDEEMLKAALDYLERMGYKDTQYLITRHLEKDNPHIHIIVNLVNDKGKRIKDFQERKRSIKVCREITEEHGYAIGRRKTHHKCEIPCDSRARTYESARYDMAKAVAKAIGGIKDISQLPAQLISDGSGITAKIKYDESGAPRGISFSKTVKDENGNRIVCKFNGSALDRKLSCGNIVKLIDLKERFPELRKSAENIIETYDANKNEYAMPKEVIRKCEELRGQLSALAKEEYRLKKEIPEGAAKGYTVIVLSLVFGNPLFALTTFLMTALMQALKENRLERVQVERESVKEDFFEVKSAFNQKPKEFQQREKDGDESQNQKNKLEKKTYQRGM